jgi:hypothetical protein
MIRNFRFTSLALCAMLLAAAAMFAPDRAGAQVLACACDRIVINVDLGVQCRVTVCMVDPAGARNCVTIAPGTRGKLPCIPGATLGFIDCNGVFVPFNPPAGGCQLGIGVGPNCCTIDACLTFDPAGCPIINVRPSILDVCPCP